MLARGAPQKKGSEKARRNGKGCAFKWRDNETRVLRCDAMRSEGVADCFFLGRDQWDGEMMVDGGGIGSRAGDGGEAWAQVGWTGGEARADIEYVCAGRGGGRGGLTRQSMGLKGGHRGGRRAVERSPGPEDRQGRTDRGASGEILWKEEGGQVDDD